MMKNLLKTIPVMALALLLGNACTNDDVPSGKVSIKYAKLVLKIGLPQGFQDVDSLVAFHVKVHNVSTGRDSSYTVPNITREAVTEGIPPTVTLDTLTIAEGLYNVELEAKAVYHSRLKTPSTVRGNLMNHTIVQNGADVASSVIVNLFSPNMDNGFVIAEIHAARTLRPSGDPYTGDQYFRITNNSDTVMYADGLFIGESAFQQMIHQNYKPYILDKETPLQYLTKVPGIHGKDKKYPVQPGASLIICDNAIDHTTADRNPNSFDLSKADWEWFDESTNPRVTDIDNPAVPNMERLYTYSRTIWGPHDRGFYAYVIGFLGVDSRTYLTDKAYQYDYSYRFVYGSTSKDMKFHAVKVPNTWILDAVVLAIKDMKKWNVISPTLDNGYAWFSEVDHDKNRYGKSVRRKYNSKTHKLIDTNDSQHDFETVKANPWYVFK